MPQSLAYGRTVDSLEVVLIQDNRGSQAILRSMISSLRVKRLRTYDRAEDALKHMMIDPPHVVVTDWDMKPMSGFRFMRLVRSQGMEPLCFVPIIVVMANATMSMVDRAFSTGANCVLVKPIAPVTMLRRLEWTTRDERDFELSGKHYVVSGIEEVLETRVRNNDFATLLRRQHAIQEALTRQAENAQDMADRIVNGEIDIDSLASRVEETAPKPRRKVDTWNSWAMN